VFTKNKECEQKGVKCGRIAANLPDQGELVRRIHLDLAAKWRERAAGIAAMRR
jgi:hypothetical protein